MNYINGYDSKTDEELVSIIRTGDKNATEVLLKRYQDLVKYSTSKFFLYGGDENDVFQEGMIGLYYAIKNYKQDSGASFKTFAKLCIDRHLITAIKLSSRQKHLLLNNAISINSTMESDENSNEVINFLKDENSEDPSEIVLRNEYLKELTSEITKNLSSKELDVLEQFKTGKSYAEIANLLNCNVKSVDTALTRIRRKANKIQEKFDNE